MTTFRGARVLLPLGLALIIAACSNGRGDVEEQEAPPAPPAQFSIGGTVTGLSGDGLVLRNNGGDDLPIVSDGGFAFPALLPSGASYDVSIAAQPTQPAQTCTVANGTGQVAGANVANVTVTCATGAFAVRGSVAGLAGQGLILRNNGADPTPIAANGPFAFPTTLPGGASYAVTVAVQPVNPAQTCTVANGAGVIGGADVTNVRVTCATPNLSVGGVVSGLLGPGLVLQNNGADNVAIARDGPFVFPTALAPGAPYNVTVQTHPRSPAQTCTVRNATGTLAGASVTNVAVSCSSDVFMIGGEVSGLAGAGLRLALNGRSSVDIVNNGAFAFPDGLASGAAYTVSVTRQPRNPVQQCTITNGAGVVGGANVRNIAVACVTTRHSIGGVVSGLTSAGLVLGLNDVEQLAIQSNGSFEFGSQLESGARYEVRIVAQPAAQSCTLSNAAGTVGGDVSNVRVACSSATHGVGGAVVGLLGSGLVLENNGGDQLAIRTDGPFRFARELAEGSRYDVRVAVQPSDPAQRCTVARGSGTIRGEVSNIEIRCATSDFTIGGAVRDLAGNGLVLSNGGDQLPIDSNGRFTFPTALPTGAPYSVAVARQPTDPDQTCSVSNGSGVVVGSNVTDISVDCATSGFRIRGRVRGLRGEGLVLRNNGVEDLAIASNGGFTFPTSLPSGSPYNVTVAAQPTDPDQTCEVDKGAGAVESRDVNDVQVRCRRPDRGDDDDGDDDDDGGDGSG